MRNVKYLYKKESSVHKGQISQVQEFLRLQDLPHVIPPVALGHSRTTGAATLEGRVQSPEVMILFAGLHHLLFQSGSEGKVCRETVKGFNNPGYEVIPDLRQCDTSGVPPSENALPNVSPFPHFFECRRLHAVPTSHSCVLKPFSISLRDELLRASEPSSFL